MTDTNATADDMEKKLSPEEVQQITKMHRDAQELVQQIGQTEVRKA